MKTKLITVITNITMITLTLLSHGQSAGLAYESPYAQAQETKSTTGEFSSQKSSIVAKKSITSHENSTGFEDSENDTRRKENGTYLPETVIGEKLLKEYNGKPLRIFLESRGWLNINSNLFEALKIDLDKVIAATGIKYNKTLARQVVGILAGDSVLDNEISLSIDIETGKLLFYMTQSNKDFEYLTSKDIPEEKLITKELAITSAKKFINKLKLEENFAPPRALDMTTEWTVLFDRHYKGYRCQGRNLKINISLNGGKILYFKDLPPIYPERLIDNIHKQGALEVAMPYLENLTGKEKDAINIWRVEKIIGLTLDPDDLNEQQLLESDYSPPPIARLVWAVGYNTTEIDAFFIYIDSETGKIVEPYLGL